MAEDMKQQGSEEEKEASKKPLDKLTVDDLRKIAKDIPEVTGIYEMKKAELLQVISAHQQTEGKGPVQEDDGLEKPLDKMTAKELREIAIKIPGVTGVHAMKKEQLVAVVKEHRGIKEEGPVRRRRKKVAKPTVSVKDLKKKIVKLREEKNKAREGKDRKRLNVMWSTLDKKMSVQNTHFNI